MKPRRRSPRPTLALIGAGRWGANIRRTLEGLPRCRLKYVETRDWRPLLRAPHLDGVLIATPGSTHAQIALPFLERGIATFIEKPLTTSLSDARALQRAAARSGALVFVGHVHLYNPAYAATKRAARRAGRLRFIFGEGMNNGPYRMDMSCLWDWAPHDLALALDLLRTKPVAVQAQAASLLRPRRTLHDVGSVRVRFANGTEFCGVYSWLAPTKRKRLTIVGKIDTIVFDDTAEQKVAVYRGLGPRVRGRAVTRQEPAVEYPPYGSTPALTAELRAFLTCIRTGRLPRSDLDQGLATVRILDAAERSITSGGRWISTD